MGVFQQTPLDAVDLIICRFVCPAWWAGASGRLYFGVLEQSRTGPRCVTSARGKWAHGCCRSFISGDGKPSVSPSTLCSFIDFIYGVWWVFECGWVSRVAGPPTPPATAEGGERYGTMKPSRAKSHTRGFGLFEVLFGWVGG